MTMQASLIEFVVGVASAATDAAPTFDFPSLLAQIGLGAVVAAPFVFTWRKAEARAEASQKRVDDLVTVMMTEFSPVLIKAQTAIEESGRALASGTEAIKELSSKQLDRSQLDALIRLLNRLDQ